MGFHSQSDYRVAVMTSLHQIYFTSAIMGLRHTEISTSLVMGTVSDILYICRNDKNYIPHVTGVDYKLALKEFTMVHNYMRY